MKLRTWGETRGAIVGAGLDLQDIEDACGYPRSILSRVMTFDPHGSPSTAQRERITAAIERLKES